MFADKILRNCILISIIVHAGVILNLRPGAVFNRKASPEQIEVTYYKKIEKMLPPALVGQKDRIAASNLNKKTTELPHKSILPPGELRKAITPTTQKLQPANMDLSSEKMRIFHKTEDFSGNPSYLTYYNLVRSRIERVANANKPYVFRVGEVNLIFTVLNNGDLKSVEAVDNISIPDQALKKSALDSVYSASPFPPFTQDMKEQQLTLQVTISFEK